jgi:hypothetical protein
MILELFKEKHDINMYVIKSNMNNNFQFIDL